MELRLSSFIAAATIAILSPLAGCSDTPDDTGAGGDGGAGGSDSGSTSASASTSSGVGSGGSGVTGSTSVSTSGVGGSTGSGSGVEPTFETVKFVIENVTCFGAGCHNDEMNRLDLQVDGDLHARLTSHMTEDCGPLVDTANPQESALIKVLKGPCGSTPRMPLECINDGDAKCVPDDYIEAMTQWIADGAKE
ncbi:hypothetical protein WME89_33515 [Sorangium sp. So ce321]|uniref:hypothetical protein n=1 Tax=Sorangium sp. So ce321 TaxID=3133300 RepID=UPI003F5E0065